MHYESSRQFIKDVSDRIDISKLDYIQDKPSLLSKILCLHHVKVALRFLKQIDQSRLVKYSDNFEKTITSCKLKQIYIKQKQVNIFLELIKMEKVSIIIILILSILSSLASIIPVYYQQLLARIIVFQTDNSQYRYFWIIISLIFFRIISFNYLIALSGCLSVNVKVQLQNLYMNSIFFVEQTQAESKRFKYLAIDAIGQAIILFPYTLVTILTIFGILGLIFILDDSYGVYALIPFCIFLISLIIQIILFIFSYHLLSQLDEIRQKRQKYTKSVFLSILILKLQNQLKRILKKIIKEKEQELQKNKKITLIYIVCQVFVEGSVILPIIIFYGLYYDKNTSMPLSNTFLSCLYLILLYLPYKIFTFSFYSIIKALVSFKSMTKNFTKIIKIQHSNRLNKKNKYSHYYFENLGNWFQFQNQSVISEIVIQEENKINQIHPFTQQFSFINPCSGQVHMLISQLNSQKKFCLYLKQFIQNLPISSSIAYIDSSIFLLPESLIQNIIMYSKFDEQKLKTVLSVIKCEHLYSYVMNLKQLQLNPLLVKFLRWHSSRLQLARALYLNVDYLILDRFILFQDEQLISNIIQQRKRQKKYTLIINRLRPDLVQNIDKIYVLVQKCQISHVKQVNIIKQGEEFIAYEGLSKSSVEHKIQNRQDNIPFSTFSHSQSKKLQLNRLIYIDFFNISHQYAHIVIGLVLTAAPCFKCYMTYLIGRSAIQQISPQYLIFGLIYLALVYLKGAVLGMYLRISSNKLFKNICQKLIRMSAHQILNIFRKNNLTLQQDFRNLDNDLIMNFQIGYTVIFQSFISITIVSIAHPIFLAMVIPVLIVMGFINTKFFQVERKLIQIKSKYEGEVMKFVLYCSAKSQKLLLYGKSQQILDKFYQKNKLNILIDINKILVNSGFRMLGEFITFIGLIVCLIIMIETQSHQIANLVMVSLGVNLFININTFNRFNFKTIDVIETQILPVTKCVNLLKELTDTIEMQGQRQNNINKIVFESIQNITFRNFSLTFSGKICKNINLQLKKGDRIAIHSHSNTISGSLFYVLHKQIFDPQEIIGEILVNDKVIISNDFNTNFKIKNIHYIHFKPFLPYDGTIYEACLDWIEGISKDECAIKLQSFWKKLKIKPLFNIEFKISQLCLGDSQIFEIFRNVELGECQMLVLVNAFDSVNLQIRKKIEHYLLNNDKISILVGITSLKQIISLYPRRFAFKNDRFEPI